MSLLWYSLNKWSKNTRCKCVCLPSYPPTSFKGVGVCVCKVHTFALTTLFASVPLQRHWVVAFVAPAPLPFHFPSFCLSVSYLIELAQKQSKDGYLTLRMKAHWCLGEVSPLPLSLNVPHSLSSQSFQENIWAGDQSEPRWRPPILLGQNCHWDTTFYVFVDTHGCF